MSNYPPSILMPHVWYPTKRPNFYIVTWGKRRIAFSYETIIGFESALLSRRWDQVKGQTWVVPVNEWSRTTARHLNWLEPDKEARVPYEQFNEMLHDYLLDPQLDGYG